MAAPFSRLQLAAALLEYDNDFTNPNALNRSAHESAIFAHLRRNNDVHSADIPRRSIDYLGVSVPSETGSLGGRESVLGQRKSRGSIDALRNPFGETDEEEEEEERLDVDLTSWGLDAFLPKEKGKGKGKAKAQSEILPNPHPVAVVQPPRSVQGEGIRGRTARSPSVGALSDFGVGGAFLEAQPGSEMHRRSMGSALDLADIQAPQPPLQRRRASTHMLIETLAVTPPLHSVPFPTGSVRSASPAPGDALRPASRSSRLDLNNGRSRNYSDASFGSKALLNNTDNEEESNPFAVRPPSPDRASRFDPKARGRTMSNATMGTMASKNMLAEENTFAVKPPSPSRSSRFDPKARGRTMSIASMGTRMMLENDYDGEESFRQQGGRDRPYSTLELLRPKVLVMPSPLQSVSVAAPPPPSPQAREGFLVSSEGRPMPPGARTMRRASMTLSAYEPSSAPIASNSFTPNPRSSLSLSQLAFRNTLVVGGQRDIAYTDIDNALPRATEEGEQAQFFEPPPIIIEKAESLAPTSMLLPPAPPPTEAELLARPAGKLYGRSLIDNLEARKANMRQKQRVFTGDDRPSMMARGQIRRSSTLIDPASLQRPVSTNLEANLARRNSANAKPLLEFNDNEGRPTTLISMPGDPKMSKSRSVFGVDTVWEQEMVKLREIEEQEKLDEEARRKREYEEAAKSKKRKGKSKGKKKTPEPEPSPEPEQEETEPDTVEARVSADPPTLPAIQKPVLKRAPPPVGDYDDDESESDVSDAAEAGRHTGGRNRSETAADRWVAESSDEDDNKPRRTPGVGLRFPNSQAPMIGVGSHNNDEDSEEDLPLAAAVERVAKRATMLPLHRQPSDDEDEDKPLSMVLSKAKLNFDAEDEDDKPLGLRASRVPFVSQTSLPLAGDDDDDKPLAFHPEHQRRTQYQMLAQAQQQQMMLQAQFTNSMFFGNPAMMGSGFFAPPMAPPPMMMAPPAPMPSPPPEDAKFGLVDRWRRDVAVEGTETS